MVYTYRRYRFTRADGTSTFDSIPSRVDPVAFLADLMLRHQAVKADPVGPTPPLPATGE